jgi:hypothetical protein
MNVIISLILIPLAIYAWASANPVQAKSHIAQLKRRWRRYLVHHRGQAVASELANEFREQAQRQGFETDQIEETISEHWPELVERLGVKETNASLGEPTPLERIF